MTCGYVLEIMWVFVTFSGDYFLVEKKYNKVKHFYIGDTECNLEF